MPRVLRIINRLNLGGPTFNASYLTRYLSPEYDTLLVSGMKDDTEASSEFIPQSLGLKPRFIHHMQRELSPNRDYRAYQEIRAIIREFRPDIVHTHAAKPGTVGRLAALHEKVPVVLHTFHGHVFHSYFSPAKTRAFLEIERYLARKTSGVIAISPLQKEELSLQFRVAPPDKVFVVPLGFDLDRFRTQRVEKRQAFRQRYHLGPDDVAVGIIGRLVPVKQHSLFIEAFAAALQRYREAGHTGRLVAFLVGDGESRAEVEAACHSAGLKHRAAHDDQPPPDQLDTDLVFTSWIQDVERAFAGLDIVALSSLNEGTPVSLIEALAAGKPVVSTEVGGIKDVLPPTLWPYLTDKRDAAGFAERLYDLASSPGLRSHCGQVAETDVFDRFGYQRLVRDMSLLYQKLLK
jgi:glycosyltransferase involved in cell wall biosynthesis